MPSHAKHLAIFLIAVSCLPAFAQQATRPTRLSIDWTKTLRISVSTPTLQVVVNPKLRPGEVVRTEAYRAFRDLDPEYARFVPWFPYPRLGVAELSAPTAAGTSWDFGLIDPPTVDFLEATKGRKGYINFSTIPAWMFKTPKPVSVPADPNKPDWDYNQGTELVDPTGKQLGDYYGRIASWYSQGGFTDERGVLHKSGHHYALPLYEVLNEADAEHSTTPKQYTERYDAIVSGIRAVSPKTQFIGLALADPRGHPDLFEYFLNHANHRPAIPLDWISYHFYAVPEVGETIDQWQYTFFSQADGFIDNVKYVESIRKRLSPNTRTMINETGSILHSDLDQVTGVIDTNIPHAYWNLAGAVYAYVYGELAKLGIDVVGESQLVGYPTQFPSVTMVDWNTGKPNARFQVLKLLHDNMGPGDRIIDTGPHVMTFAASPIVETAYIRNGMRKVLLINRRAAPAIVDLTDAAGSAIQTVDQVSAGGPIRREKLGSSTITLGGFAVAIVDLPKREP
jgi:hypothetical protein